MKYHKIVLFAAMAMLIFNACKKDTTTPEEPEPEPKEVIVNEWVTIDKKGIVNVKDLKIGSTRRIYIFFSLDSMKIVEASEALTNKWDLAFFNANAAVIYPNLGTTTDVDAPHYGGSGKVLAAFVAKPFDEVTAPPAADQFDQTGRLGTYIKERIAEEAAHWGYWVYSENGTGLYTVPYSNKTMVFKLGDGRYAKFQYQSNYKGGLLTPTLADYIPANLGYANFRYYISKKGSTDLTTK